MARRDDDVRGDDRIDVTDDRTDRPRDDRYRDDRYRDDDRSRDDRYRDERTEYRDERDYRDRERPYERTEYRTVDDRRYEDDRRYDIDRDQNRVTEGNGSAIASLVTGLLAATFGFLFFTAIGAILFGLAAIVLGAVGVKKAKSLGGLNKGLAITGIVSGILGLLLGAAVVIGSVSILNNPQFQQMVDQVQQQGGQIEQNVEEEL